MGHSLLPGTWGLTGTWCPGDEVGALACRMGSCTGAMPGQTRSSGLTWRQVRTARWFCPTTTWTCSRCLCLRISSTGVTGEGFRHGLLLGRLFPPSLPQLTSCSWLFPSPRTHANGSIKRGSKDNATDSVPLRTGIGVQLKDIKVFNRDRQKGEARLWAAQERPEAPWAGIVYPREPRVKGARREDPTGHFPVAPEAQGW